MDRLDPTPILKTILFALIVQDFPSIPNSINAEDTDVEYTHINDVSNEKKIIKILLFKKTALKYEYHDLPHVSINKTKNKCDFNNFIL